MLLSESTDKTLCVSTCSPLVRYLTRISKKHMAEKSPSKGKTAKQGRQTHHLPSHWMGKCNTHALTTPPGKESPPSPRQASAQWGGCKIAMLCTSYHGCRCPVAVFIKNSSISWHVCTSRGLWSCEQSTKSHILHTACLPAENTCCALNPPFTQPILVPWMLPSATHSSIHLSVLELMACTLQLFSTTLSALWDFFN